MRTLSLSLWLTGLIAFLSAPICMGQTVPQIHDNLGLLPSGLVVTYDEKVYPEVSSKPVFTLEQAMGSPKGTRTGLAFNFQAPKLEGTLYYGFIPYGDALHPHPVFFKRTAEVKKGKAQIPIKGQLEGRYDMVGWKEKGYGTMGYRLVTPEGLILYDGRVTFSFDGKFTVEPTIVQGPFVSKVADDQVVIWFETSEAVGAVIQVKDHGVVMAEGPATHHEITIEGLEPKTKYAYTVALGKAGAALTETPTANNSTEMSLETVPHQETYHFTSAPAAGTKSAFTFAYASDSRSGQGGGERDIYGANAYIMKKIMALAMQQEVAFFQFSGDLINGYLTSPEETDLQYANWKHAIEPFAHYFPVYVSMGNHEALIRGFALPDHEGYPPFQVDRFPYETESAEAVFARNFVNPSNGPVSEDGNRLDPNPNAQDFPPYRENVFSYIYDNVAVVVLNSDYWYAPSTSAIPVVSGGMHGYIMDGQVAFLKQELAKFEADPTIDHVFLTQHTPFFPNGGHVKDDMWYGGNNQKRPFIAGKPVGKGIIERRDELLDLVVNQSTKVRAILTGDEHNYAKTEIGPDMPRYPVAYPDGSKVALTRTIYQINNGAAGAPYYAQEQTPWSDFVSGFTTQNALVLFDVEGQKLTVRVLNPDTLELIETYTLSE